MTRNRKRAERRGYTLIELMLVIAILALIGSIILPRYDLVLIKAYQAKTKSNLGTVRTGISLYYSDTEGHYPLEDYGPGSDHFDNDGLSLSTVLAPKWIDKVPIPLLKDRTGQFNGLNPGDWDKYVTESMSATPIDDVYIVLGAPGVPVGYYTPYFFDNRSGTVYIPNGNYDSTGKYFFEW